MPRTGARQTPPAGASLTPQWSRPTSARQVPAVKYLPPPAAAAALPYHNLYSDQLFGACWDDWQTQASTDPLSGRRPATRRCHSAQAGSKQFPRRLFTFSRPPGVLLLAKRPVLPTTAAFADVYHTLQWRRQFAAATVATAAAAAEWTRRTQFDDTRTCRCAPAGDWLCRQMPDAPAEDHPGSGAIARSPTLVEVLVISRQPPPDDHLFFGRNE